MTRSFCHYCWLGQMEYGAAWELQRRLARARAEGLIPDTLLLLEHPPTYTLGRRAKETHLLVPEEVLVKQGVALYRVDRGGDITYHGPGQLVGYPILDLSAKPGGASRYLRDIEEALIATLKSFGLSAGRMTGFTGVWIKEEKIAAIGVKINARRITQHGFALNVSTDLGYFGQIVPCGITDKGVTSLSRILGRAVDFGEVIDPVAAGFGQVFGTDMVRIGPEAVAALMEEHFEGKSCPAGRIGNTASARG